MNASGRALLVTAAFAVATFGSFKLWAKDIESCRAELLGYKGWEEAPDQEWHLRLDGPTGGALHYYGASHERDPAHPQFAEIEAAFAEFRPTVVYFEGPDRGVGADEEDSIRTRGESGFTRFLAVQAGADVKSLEPTPGSEVPLLFERFGPEKTSLFFVLREATRLRDREGLSGPALEGAVDGLIAKVLEMGLPLAFKDTGQMQAAYARHWQTPAHWSEAPADWFTPGGDGSGTGGVFTHDINRTVSEFRDAHMYESLAKDVLNGQRVFAVVGRNHVPMQAPALRCALQ